MWQELRNRESVRLFASGAATKGISFTRVGRIHVLNIHTKIAPTLCAISEERINRLAAKASYELSDEIKRDHPAAADGYYRFVHAYPRRLYRSTHLMSRRMAVDRGDSQRNKQRLDVDQQRKYCSNVI
jgi:hypothetical protein